MESHRPLLIVNADDLGYNEPATDAIAECFRAGRITSATAMVYMRDSDRAAEIAREIGLPVGLHVNFTEPFDDPNVPADLRARHLTLVREFGGPSFVYRARRWKYSRRLKDPVSRCIAEQLERFEALYGGPPTHVDGHMHVQVCPNIGLSPAIPAGMKMRNALGMPPLASGPMSRLVAARQRIILRGRLSTEYFLNITDLHPEFLEGGVRKRLGLAERTSVELMAHPGFCHEYTMLMAPEWEEWTAGLKLGSYRELS
jgi:chitin disaccharide deacetylase